jgi:hypothetical protein
MLTLKNMPHYVLTLSLVMIASYVGGKFKQSFSEHTNDDYKLIRKYLLNETPLYGFNKPKIWIHTKYEINARNWKSYGSRNSKELNQPYLHLTIQSIIDHCSKDFHICLIDDNTFSNLIPGWDIDICNLPEPIKTCYRQIGMLKILNVYGGMIVPNSFVCKTNLKSIYNEGVVNDSAFVTETVNRTLHNIDYDKVPAFVPDTYFMGSSKNNVTLNNLIEHITNSNSNGHYSSEKTLTGDINNWCIKAINQHKLNLIGGEKVGVKNLKNKPIVVDDLMEEQRLELHTSCCGVYIPADEILKRIKFQWFCSISRQHLLNTKLSIVNYMKESMVDASDLYTDDTDKYTSAVSI